MLVSRACKSRFLKGTGVVANLTACHRDPKHWKNPDKFDPEHFLDDNGKFVEDRDGFVPYGIGKYQRVFTKLLF